MPIFGPGFLHSILGEIDAVDMTGSHYDLDEKTPVSNQNFCRMNNNHPNHDGMTESYGMNTDEHFLYTPENL